MERAKILGIKVDITTMQETLDWIEAAIRERKPKQIITANPEMVMMAQENEQFFQVMNNADLVVADGIGLVIALRRYLKVNVPERVPGFEIGTNFLSLAQKKGYTVYLLGAAPGVAEEAKKRLEEKHPGLKIIGTHHGFLNDENRPKVFSEIASLKPDMLILGMGAPRQDMFAAQYKEQLQVPITIGLGGSIDIWAGNKKRAPKFMQKVHLEWFYRLIKEPTRFLRMMSLPKFAILAAIYKERRLP